MKIIKACQRLDKSIFLAGPTPRDKHVESWRPNALKILDELGFDGTVFVPEPEEQNDWSDNTYDSQLNWEWEALNQSTVVVFWVPRDDALVSMPAFTTNVEFGMMAHTSKCLLGSPTGTRKMRYLEALAIRYQIPVFNNLENLMEAAIDKTKDPFITP